MAARIRSVRLDDRHRAKIQTSQLINRLTDHAKGKIDLLPTQVKAIEVLLRKTLPDLTSVDLQAKVEQVSHIISDQPLTEEEWAKQYARPEVRH